MTAIHASSLHLTLTSQAKKCSCYSGHKMQNFMLLPDKLMEVIFEYAQPPDVYNLHFSNKTIHERRYMHSLKGNADDGHFTSYVQKLLERNMKLSLGWNRANINRNNADMFESFSCLAKSLPPHSVALSGSIVLQAVLGEKWDESDIDIYCTQEAAPTVRSWLIGKFEQVLVDVLSEYNTTHNPVIHHVEGWANEPAGNKTFEARGETWRFDKAACSHESPISFWGRDLYEDDVVIDNNTPSIAIRTQNDYTDIPFEPRLLHQKDDSGRCKTKKEIVNIDLVVVDDGSSIAEVVNGSDLVICKCSCDGSKFFIPKPSDTFSRLSELSESLEVRKTRAYTNQIEQEAQRTFQSMISELRNGRKGLKLSDNFWLRFKEETSNRVFLEDITKHQLVVKELELILDQFNVFSDRLDDKLPDPILWVIKMMRAMLLENVLAGTKNVSPRSQRTGLFFQYNKKTSFLGMVRDLDMQPNVVLNNVANMLLSRHNTFMRSLDRVKKYRSRGIDIKPETYPPSKCCALRELKVDVVHRNPYELRRRHPSSVEEQWDLGPRFIVSEEEKWAAYHALVEEVKHKAWVSSIPSLPPMGIPVLSDVECSLKPSASVASLMKPIGSNDSKAGDLSEKMDKQSASKGNKICKKQKTTSG